MTTINLTARQFADLVRPIVPLAGSDDMLPVINAVLVETDGKWLSATATDRFRVGIKRIEKRPNEDDESPEWPEFRALIPLRAVRSLLATYKALRNSDPSISLTVEDDRLITEGVGGFDLFDSSRIVHHLEMGEFPKVRSIFRGALSVPASERVNEFGFDPAFMADFKACGSRGLRVLTGAPKENGKPGPIILSDDNGFLAALMPKVVVGDRGHEDWSDFLAEKPEPKKVAAAKRSRAKKASAA